MDLHRFWRSELQWDKVGGTFFRARMILWDTLTPWRTGHLEYTGPEKRYQYGYPLSTEFGSFP
jgi:hypothetical protein